MGEQSPWETWCEEGPNLGYTAELDHFSFPDGLENGLQIKGLHDDFCSGFFSFRELEGHGFSPTHIAGAEVLAEIKARRSAAV